MGSFVLFLVTLAESMNSISEKKIAIKGKANWAHQVSLWDKNKPKQGGIKAQQAASSGPHDAIFLGVGNILPNLVQEPGKHADNHGIGRLDVREGELEGSFN